MDERGSNGFKKTKKKFQIIKGTKGRHEGLIKIQNTTKC